MNLIFLTFLFNSIYAVTVDSAYHGQGTGPIHYTFIYCEGSENSISECHISTSNTCFHSEDLGVICGEGRSRTYLRISNITFHLLIN